MIRKIISGGQTGADQGGLLAAAHYIGCDTGGWAPRGWATEAGPAPWLAEYKLRECPVDGYPTRTLLNVLESDGTVYFLARPRKSNGYWLTRRLCEQVGKPFIVVDIGLGDGVPSGFRAWIASHGIEVLNVAGNRESIRPREGDDCDDWPGVASVVEDYLNTVFRKK